MFTWCTTSLTFKTCTLCPHCTYVFCVYLRTNSDLCHLQHKLIGFYNPDEKCLQRGTDWGFKYSGLCFVFKGLMPVIVCVRNSSDALFDRQTDTLVFACKQRGHIRKILSHKHREILVYKGNWIIFAPNRINDKFCSFSYTRSQICEKRLLAS